MGDVFKKRQNYDDKKLQLKVSSGIWKIWKIPKMEFEKNIYKQQIQMQQVMPVVTSEMECQHSATTVRNNIDCFTSSGITVSKPPELRIVQSPTEKSSYARKWPLRWAIEYMYTYAYLFARWKKKTNIWSFNRGCLRFCRIPVASHVFKYYISLLVNTEGVYATNWLRNELQPNECTPIFSNR